MNTVFLNTTAEDIARAAAMLKGGGLVAFPTETVYGLGADALNKDAVQKIFTAKGRPSDNPFIVHIASYDLLSELVFEIPPAAEKLIDLFWPGPLTIVFKKKRAVPIEVTAGLNTVGVRMPKNAVALDLLKKSGIPIAAPSANISGRPSPTEAGHVVQDLNGRINAIVDGGPCSVGLESTVVDLSENTPVLLRPGAVTFEQLTAALGRVEKNFEYKDGHAPKSPGIKYKHYSPKASVIVVEGDIRGYVEKNMSKYKKIGVITTDCECYPKGCLVKRLGTDPIQYAAKLFAYLRELDNRGVDVIFASDIADSGIGLAVKNRLYKAAGYNIINGERGRE